MILICARTFVNMAHPPYYVLIIAGGRMGSGRPAGLARRTLLFLRPRVSIVRLIKKWEFSQEDNMEWVSV